MFSFSGSLLKTTTLLHSQNITFSIYMFIYIFILFHFTKKCAAQSSWETLLCPAVLGPWVISLLSWWVPSIKSSFHTLMIVLKNKGHNVVLNVTKYCFYASCPFLLLVPFLSLCLLFPWVVAILNGGHLPFWPENWTCLNLKSSSGTF